MSDDKADVCGRINIIVVSGVEGPSIYMNDYRVAGPKPWGGGKEIHSWTIDLAEFESDFEKIKQALGGPK